MDTNRMNNNTMRAHEVSKLMPPLKLYVVLSSPKIPPSLSSRKVQSQPQVLLVLQNSSGTKEPLSTKQLVMLLNNSYRSHPRRVCKSAFIMFSLATMYLAHSRALPPGRLANRLVCVSDGPPACMPGRLQKTAPSQTLSLL